MPARSRPIHKAAGGALDFLVRFPTSSLDDESDSPSERRHLALHMKNEKAGISTTNIEPRSTSPQHDMHGAGFPGTLGISVLQEVEDGPVDNNTTEYIFHARVLQTQIS